MATHMAAVTGATACDKLKARSAYSNINQDSTKSVASLKKRIDNALKVYDAVGQSRPADEELAADFIRKLDANRFAGLRADLENKQLVSGQDLYPKTLVDAYSMAVNYKVIVPISDNKVGVVAASTVTAAALSIKVDNVTKAKKGKPKKREAEEADHVMSNECNSE